jgi:hypothetical protein
MILSIWRMPRLPGIADRFSLEERIDGHRDEEFGRCQDYAMRRSRRQRHPHQATGTT